MSIGIGSFSSSGLPPDIVDKLVEVEKKPIYNLERSKQSLASKKALLNDLKARINAVPVKDIRDIHGFKEFKIETSSSDALIASVDKRLASPSSHSIEIKSLATKASALSTGFPDRDKSYIGVGYLSYKNAEGENVELYIGKGNNTLDGVANLINNNPDFGFKANVINDGKDPKKPFKLILNGEDTGNLNNVKWNRSYFLDGDYDFYIENTKNASNAEIVLDGFDIKLANNKVSDILPGVSIELLKAEPGKEIKINVSEDLVVVTDKVKNIVNSINRVLEFIQIQNSLTAESNTKDTLGGDVTLTTIESKIRRLFTSPIPGSSEELKYLSEVGIGFQRNGLLGFDEARFKNMINEDFEAVSSLFIGQNDGKTGLIPLLNKEFTDFNNNESGIINTREASLNRKTRYIDDDIDRKERNIERKREQLKRTFASLESSIAGLKSQGNYVQSALASK